MILLRVWQKYLIWLLVFWSIATLVYRPGWLVFAAGCLVWIAVVYVAVPGIFWSYLALISFNPGKTEKYLQKAISAQPPIPNPYSSLGLICFRQKKWTEAITLLNQAISLSAPKSTRHLQIVLAAAYRENNENETAVAILRKLVDQGNANQETYLNLAISCFKLNQLDEALLAANKARSMNLKATNPVLILGRIHFAQRDFQAAKNDYEWAIPHLSWPVESFYWLGRAELELGELETAVNHLQTALERITEDPDFSDVPLKEVQEWLDRAIEIMTIHLGQVKNMPGI